MAYTVEMGTRQFYGLRGNVHIHTTTSDGTKTHQEIGRLAAQEGLDFIVITDHNVYKPDLDAYVEGTLLLVGQEIHDPDREVQSSHTLCFDLGADMYEHAGDPQELIDAVDAEGGFTFLAHPFEREVAEWLPEPNLSWRDWQVEGYAGIELWNYMSEFKAVLKNKAQAILYAHRPELAITAPYPETLQMWDKLLASKRVSVLGGSDAHATTYHMGPIEREVLPYDYLFRCINTHLLSGQPLTGDVELDKATIYKALKAGCGFVGYEQPAPVAGFTFWASSGDKAAIMGQDLDLEDRVELRATTPAEARLHLLRDGETVARTQGDRLALVSHEPGVYRVEAYRRFAGKERGWIYSNPIYVR